MDGGREGGREGGRREGRKERREGGRKGGGYLNNSVISLSLHHPLDIDAGQVDVLGYKRAIYYLLHLHKKE